MLKKESSSKGVGPIILIIIGIAFFTLGTLTRLSTDDKPLQNYTLSKTKDNEPKEIFIPNLNIKIPIIRGDIVNGEWILDDKSALFLPTSGSPGEGYNTIIYAHNKDNLFGSLKNLSLGDKILIKSEKRKNFAYKIFSIEVIQPNDIFKLMSDTPDTLTLFTCDGWFDESRLLIRGRLESSGETINLSKLFLFKTSIKRQEVPFFASTALN